MAYPGRLSACKICAGLAKPVCLVTSIGAGSASSDRALCVNLSRIARLSRQFLRQPSPCFSVMVASVRTVRIWAQRADLRLAGCKETL